MWVTVRHRLDPLGCVDKGDGLDGLMIVPEFFVLGGLH